MSSMFPAGSMRSAVAPCDGSIEVGRGVVDRADGSAFALIAGSSWVSALNQTRTLSPVCGHRDDRRDLFECESVGAGRELLSRKFQ